VCFLSYLILQSLLFNLFQFNLLTCLFQSFKLTLTFVVMNSRPHALFLPTEKKPCFCLVVVFNEHDYDYQLFAFHYTYFQISKQ